MRTTIVLKTVTVDKQQQTDVKIEEAEKKRILKKSFNF